jgi:hypothetical protein
MLARRLDELEQGRRRPVGVGRDGRRRVEQQKKLDVDLFGRAAT